jgi:hypothetical protein
MFRVDIQGCFQSYRRVHGSALHRDLCIAGREAHANFAGDSACFTAYNEHNYLLNFYTVLRYTAGSAVHAWELVYDLSAVGSSYQRYEPFVPS